MQISPPPQKKNKKSNNCCLTWNHLKIKVTLMTCVFLADSSKGVYTLFEWIIDLIK